MKTKISRMIFSTASVIANRIFPMQENKVCFLSDVRVNIGGNMEDIYNYNKEKDYAYVFEFREDRRNKRTMLQYLKLIKNLSTSKYIILDDYCGITSFLEIRKGQELVQLWHGAGAYKKFGFSRVGTGENVGNIHQGYKKYTKAIVSSEDVRWCFAEAFSIPMDNVKATGIPRTDILFDEEYKQKIRNEFIQKYPQCKGKKIVLFAPTWRGTQIKDAYYDMGQLDFKQLYNELHEEYVFAIKWHPAINNNISRGNLILPDLSVYGDFYVDLSEYRDINDLLILSDMLITDYSSVIFDYVLLDKPLIYYVYDLDEYAGYGGRGLYFDFDEYVYGKVVKETELLIDAIKEEAFMHKNRECFRKKFMNACEGNSTEQTCEWIFSGNATKGN